MATQDERRSFIKYLLSLTTFIAGSTLSVNKSNGLIAGRIGSANAQSSGSFRKRIKKIGVEEHCGKEVLAGIDGRLKDMDNAGIDMQVLSSVFGSSLLAPEEATLEAKRMNDELSKVVAKYPQRFSAFAKISLQDVDANAKELERAVKQLGLKGAIISEHLFDGGVNLYDKKYGPIWETAEELEVPVFFHFGGALEGVIGMGAVITLQVMGMIEHGIFNQHPGLKIILGHLGEAMPFWLWRIDDRWLADKNRTPRPQASDLPKSPGQYFKDNFYVNTSGQFSATVLQFVCSVLGAERILFAVDYPVESAIEGAKFIESAPISDGDKEKICHLNAEKLFKITG
jgi:predicted TIM-barrel fold metal-dependent hydrolase